MDISNCTYIMPHAIRVYIFFLCSKKQLCDLTVIKSICQLCNCYRFFSFISKKIQKKIEITFWFFIKQKVIKKTSKHETKSPSIYSIFKTRVWILVKKLWKKAFSMFFLELNKISTTLSKFTDATLQCYPY